MNASAAFFLGALFGLLLEHIKNRVIERHYRLKRQKRQTAMRIYVENLATPFGMKGVADNAEQLKEELDKIHI